jgi:hypothetical protein
MHLTGEANAPNLFGPDVVTGQELLDGRRRRSPPIARILFCPAGLRRGKRLMFDRGGGNDLAEFLD